jgi:hypothetical protein
MPNWTNSSPPTAKPATDGGGAISTDFDLTTFRRRSPIIPAASSHGEVHLPPQSDDSERPSTLPQEELNPLLNPTLGRNLGRWAEVYFTSTPEKRDEAVQQLIRELNENPAQDEAAGSQPVRRPSPQEMKPQGSPIADGKVRGATCFWCGYINRPRHKFCGRCGEPLTLPDADLPGIEQRRGPAPVSETDHRRIETLDSAARMFPSLQPAASSNARTFPPRQSRDFDVSTETPFRGRFRVTARRPLPLWFVALLVVVVVVSAYVGWRGGSSRIASRNAAQATQPAATRSPISTTDSATTDSARTDSATTSSATSGSSINPIPNPTAGPKTEPPASLATSIAATGKPVPSVAAPTNAAVTPDPSPGVTGKGAAELALAQEFLIGANGKQPNKSMAVQWLWKAVRKENVEATVLLSDLYLRGDGVPKSCDQARLLLDAAAIKGRKDAAEQLRNLAAFGCE